MQTTPQSKNSDQIAGNYYDKFNAKNPIVKLMMRNFFAKFDQLIAPIEADRILEVGCGEGRLLEHVHSLGKDSYLEGMDNSQEIIELAQKDNPQIKFKTASVTELPYAESEFNLVIASEVLEHIEDYKKAIHEIERVGERFFIFSVPQEPIWRVLNIVRLKYINRLGNTPGHINHWNKKSFLKLLSQYFRVVKETSPFPWTMVLCEKVK